MIIFTTKLLFASMNKNKCVPVLEVELIIKYYFIFHFKASYFALVFKYLM